MKTMKPFIIACSIWLVAARSVALAQTTFTKVTTGPVVTDAATSFSATWVDFDNDGGLDLYVTNPDGANLLYRNDGQGMFTKITNSPIVKVGAGSFGNSWADLDNDGRIDLFIGRQHAQGLLFRQQADGTFTKSTLPLSQSFGAARADYDNDGLVDLLVADEA